MNSTDQNIIFTPGPGFVGLEDTMSFLINTSEGDARGRLVAENARRVFWGRYLTPASISCYWRRAIRGYASVLRFEMDTEGAQDYESFSVR
jgi:hypothetical protein